MPTGYTCQIETGITFEQFALNCSRAFGALSNMRDDPSGTPIPNKIKPRPQPTFTHSLKILQFF